MWVLVSANARVIGSPGASSTGGCKLPDLHAGNWPQKTQEEQYMLLTAEPSLQPHAISLTNLLYVLLFLM